MLCTLYPFIIFVCLSWCIFNSTAVGAVEEGAENTAAATEPSKLSDQDKVQWLTDRLAHSVTDLSRTRLDQTSSSTAEKGRWVERGKQIFSRPIFDSFKGISEELF